MTATTSNKYGDYQGNRHPTGRRIKPQGICTVCGAPKDIHTSTERRSCAMEGMQDT